MRQLQLSFALNHEFLCLKTLNREPQAINLFSRDLRHSESCLSPHHRRLHPLVYTISFPSSLTTPTMSLPEITKTFEPFFSLSDEHLNRIVERFRTEFTEGLASYGKDTAMVPSFVTGVPDGSEQGTFLALDLGGTNLRVCEVQLFGSNKFEIKQQKYKVSDELKKGQARVLFDYIADSVDAFLTEIGSRSKGNEPLHLGFTFR